MVAEKQRYAFISYSRVDKDFALKLARELRAGGYPVWLDLLDIPTGSRWDDEVEKALRECSIFLILLTPASITSMNVKDEIGFAIDNDKRILPILVEKCQVPLRLSRFQYIDFTMKSFEEGVVSAKKLLTSLNKDTQSPVETKAGTKRTAKQSSQIGQKTKEEAKSPTKQTSISRQLIRILGLIVLVVGLIAIFSFLQNLDSGENTTTSPPISSLTSMSMPSPTVSGNTNISVSGQTGYIGFVLFPNGQLRDLVNGIFALPQGSRVTIVQNNTSIYLADGTSLYMPSGTVFNITKIQDGFELMLEQGSILARLAAGAVPLSIKTQDGLIAQVSGSIMGVQNSLAPRGIFVDCYEGNCTISGETISELRLEGPNRFIFYAAGNVSPSDQTERCEFWGDAIGAETLLGLGPCTEQQVATPTPTPTPTSTPTPTLIVNAEATQKCIKWLKEHHNKTSCP